MREDTDRKRGNAAPKQNATPRATGSRKTGSARASAAPARKAEPRRAPARGDDYARRAPVRRAPAYEDYYDELPVRRPPAQRAGVKRRRKKKKNPLVTVLLWVLAIALAYGVSVYLRGNVFELYTVRGDAMYATLDGGDVVCLDKRAYQNGEAPVRGDIVAVSLPQRGGVVLRRIVGMPGETVELSEDGGAVINGVALVEPYISLRNYDYFGVKTLPANQYYVLGDNRSDTGDSRSDAVGLIRADQIIGKASLVVWPLGRWRSLF